MNEPHSNSNPGDPSRDLSPSDELRHPSWLLFVMGWVFAGTSLQWAKTSEFRPPLPQPGPIDLSAAPARVLRRLPGIGPTRSAAIVETRWQRGGQEFELNDVPGIGERTRDRALEGLEGLREFEGLPELEDTNEGHAFTPSL